MTNQFKVIKLDGRHTGASNFKYMIEFRLPYNSNKNQFSNQFYDETHRFISAQSWCRDNYGLGVELDMFEYLNVCGIYTSLYPTSTKYPSQTQITDTWAMKSKNYNKHLRIYLKTEEILSHFLLTHLDNS